MACELHCKRIYLPPSPGDGLRLLVDGLWPRGIAKDALAADAWVKAVAPSAALRRWFAHDSGKWLAFRQRYFAELDANADAVAELNRHLRSAHRVTLLFAARDEARNNAVALRAYLRQQT